MGANISYNELAQGFNATYRIAFYFIDESVQMKIKDMMGDLFYSYCDEKDLTSHSLLDKPDLIIAGRRDMQLSYLKEVCLANDLVVSKEKVDGAIWFETSKEIARAKEKIANAAMIGNIFKMQGLIAIPSSMLYKNSVGRILELIREKDEHTHKEAMEILYRLSAGPNPKLNREIVETLDKMDIPKFSL